MRIRIAVVGLGKIAHDQHLPTITSSADFELVAAASFQGTADGVPLFRSIDELLASGIAIDAVAMCQPPQGRFDAAAKAIKTGKHVLLEKPPGSTVTELAALTKLADAGGTTIFAAWHARYAPGVDEARSWLTRHGIQSMTIAWKEDVRRWHPGQRWIWDPGGFGVFDAGINALSIATLILPSDIFIVDGQLEVPENRTAPIAARLRMSDVSGLQIEAEFDWRQAALERWDITVATDAGQLLLTHGGSRLTIDGRAQALHPSAEYAEIYAHFATLIREGRSDADGTPLRLVAEAFLRCRQITTSAFAD